MANSLSFEEFKLWKEIPLLLIRRGEELLAQPYQKIEFTRNVVADELLNNLQSSPHAFVLACVMDRQIKAERAWMIPYQVSQELSSFTMETLLKNSLDDFTEIFTRRSFHRFNTDMAKYFYLGIKRIHEQYHDDASNIWKNNPASASVVRRFLQIDGVGIKIATMAANILARDFKISLKERLCIDISPDIQVIRVFKRLGLIADNSSADELLYRARELNPEYPGIFDLSSWEIGRNWCRPNPDKVKYRDCYLDNYCPKFI